MSRSFSRRGGDLRPVRHAPRSRFAVRDHLRRVAGVAMGMIPVLLSPPPVCAQAPAPFAGKPLPPANSPIEREIPRSLPAVSPNGLRTGDADPSEVPNLPIDVRRVEVTGASLFGAEAAALTAGLTGTPVPLPRLNEAREAIVRLYRGRGYALSAVSLAIDRASGTVRFEVTEGRIAAVRLDGDIGPAGAMVLRFLNRLTEFPAIESDTLERYLLLAQDIPGVSLSTVLEPSNDEPGALTLIAQVSLKRVTGQVSLDNRAFELTGPIQFLGIADLNGLTSRGDKTEIALFHSLPNSQNFGQISTELFIGSSGLKVKVYGGAGVTAPTGNLAALNYTAITNVFGGQLSYPWIRTRRTSLTVYAAADALESVTTTRLSRVTTQGGADQLRVLRLGEDFAVSDLFLGAARPATNQLSARLSRGFDILGGFHGTALPPSTARANERHNFTALKFEMTRTQTLFVPWEGASIGFLGLVTGQYAPGILPPAEQFYLGGARFTRGFYAGQVPGDKAIAATAEVQLNATLDLSAVGGRAESASQFYLFYDWGETWQNQASDPAARLVSAGGGLRLQLTGQVELDLEALGRITKRPAPATAELNGIGLYWRLVGRF